jgi:hypothetical protein
VGAEAAYRRILEIEPMYVVASFNLGNILRTKADLAGAEAACT